MGGVSLKPRPLQRDEMKNNVNVLTYSSQIHTHAVLAEFPGCDRGNEAALCALSSSAFPWRNTSCGRAGRPQKRATPRQTHLNLWQRQPQLCRWGYLQWASSTHSQLAAQMIPVSLNRKWKQISQPQVFIFHWTGSPIRDVSLRFEEALKIHLHFYNVWKNKSQTMTRVWIIHKTPAFRWKTTFSKC